MATWCSSHTEGINAPFDLNQKGLLRIKAAESRVICVSRLANGESNEAPLCDHIGLE